MSEHPTSNYYLDCLVSEAREYAEHLKAKDVDGFTIVQDLVREIERLRAASEPEMSKKALSCKVVGGVLRIEVGISTLKHAAEHHEGFWQPQTDKYALIVKDERVFAKDVARELMREREDGSTPIHLLLDKAIEEAVNNGSEGCDYDAMDAIARAAVNRGASP